MVNLMNRKELIEHYSKKRYIGDSVYIHSDGYHFILETHNGLPNDPSNRIALEPSVIDKILLYQEELYTDFEKLNIEENKKTE